MLGGVWRRVKGTASGIWNFRKGGQSRPYNVVVNQSWGVYKWLGNYHSHLSKSKGVLWFISSQNKNWWLAVHLDCTDCYLETQVFKEKHSTLSLRLRMRDFTVWFSVSGPAHRSSKSVTAPSLYLRQPAFLDHAQKIWPKGEWRAI